MNIPAIVALCIAPLFYEQDDNIRWSYSNATQFTNGAKYYDSCNEQGCYDVCLSNVSAKSKSGDGKAGGAKGKKDEPAKPQGFWRTIVKPYPKVEPAKPQGFWRTIVKPYPKVEPAKPQGFRPTIIEPYPKVEPAKPQGFRPTIIEP